MSYKTELFPDLTFETYLNHAAISPLNIKAKQAMLSLMDTYAQVGMKGWMASFRCRERLRGKLARLIGAEADTIGLTQNTSHGLLTAAHEFDWRDGDSLILIRGEFPSNVLPWLSAAKRHKLTVHWLTLDDLETQNETFQTAIAAKPRLLAVSWVQYQTGRTVSPRLLAQLQDQYNISVCLDAIQGVGALQLNLAETPIDLVSAGGHKWMLSPEGTGFVYIAPHLMERLNPLFVSWLSQEDPASFLFDGPGLVNYEKAYQKIPSRVEMGATNNFAYAAMEASVDLILETGPAAIEAQVLKLAQQCREGMKALGLEVCNKNTHSGLACASLPNHDLRELSQRLDRESVAIATPDGHLRAAPHFYNDEHDVERFLTALKKNL